MADVAAVFHWPPAAFDEMTIEELMHWRHLAIDRAEKLGFLGKRE